MAIKLSNLIKKQLPEFISTHYSAFSTFLEKYYEGLETTGQPLDILSNLTEYYDINFYEKQILKEGSYLVGNVDVTDSIIEVEDGSSFPRENGYIKINDEICFYSYRVGDQFFDVIRGVSGNTKLGDLYSKTTFVNTESQNHSSGDYVQNISNLFLFAIIKSFEKQYLESIPEKYLKKQIDKKTLIKNITSFYKSKGSEKSIKFIFKTLVSDTPSENVYIKRPTDQTLKASVSDWISDYVVKINLISGDPQNLVGEQIIQESPYASFVIERVRQNSDGSVDLIIDPSSVISEFKIAGYTKLVGTISPSDQENFVIDVVSTRSWNLSDNKLYIGNEEFLISDRNVNQFRIKSRAGSLSYSGGTYVYSKKPYNIGGVRFVVTGSVYNLNPKTKIPYAFSGDEVVSQASARNSNDRIVFNSSQNSYRWIKNQNRERPSILTNSTLQSQLSKVNANVSAIFEDENYFYICSSGYPSFDILSSQFSGSIGDNKYLKLIKKNASTSTDSYETGTDDVGILVDGTLIYGKKSNTFVKYGPITKVNILNKGNGYLQPPIVLVNGSPSKARAILSGEVVSEIEVITTQDYKKTPNVVITSGRGGIIEAKVTSGRITNLVIVDPGEYYVSPPKIVITDRMGKGNFAEYKSIISRKGTIVGFEKVNEGRNYSAENVIVQVIPQGDGAEAEFEIKRWYKNRFEELSEIDQNGGSLVQKKFDNNQTYAIVGNPKKLRYTVGDNVTSTLQESITGHSKIIGYAYDGNPIYGPYGYSNPLNPASTIARMRSGYALNASRNNGPSVSLYPLGTFDEDYTWSPNVNTGKLYLDQNNGRFCVTPEYPEGTYAYFLSIDTSGNPVYPYFIGKNYYSIPVDSNYNKPITQNDIPRSAKLLDFSQYLDNGRSFSAVISEVESGNIKGFVVDQSVTQHNPGNLLYVDNSGTLGSGFSGSVETVTGKEVDYLQSKDSVCVLLTDSPVYLFKDYLLKQQNTNFTGSIVGDVRFDNKIVLQSVGNKFDEEELFDLVNPSNNQVVKILSIVLDQNSSYTSGATLKLTDGKTNPNSIKATGTVLETSSSQNTVRVLVNSGNFDLGVDNDILFLQSSDLGNTIGTKIITTSSISEDISVFNIDYNYAILKTNDSHNLVVNDTINVSINPDDSETEKTYYVRKRLFQTIVLKDQKLNARLQDTGIGKLSILTGGLYSTNGIFTANLGNATASVTITRYFDYSNPQLTVTIPGTGYTVGNRIEVSGGSGDGLIINIDSVGPSGQILSVSVSDPGFDYLDNDNITPVQDGTGAVIKIDYNSYNSVSNILITNKGSGFEEDDILTLQSLSGVTQIKPALFRVDHVGLSAADTVIKSSSVENIAVDDYLLIEKEIVKVTSIDYSQRKITVLRGQKGTTAEKHFDKAVISFDNFVYRFTPGEYIPELGEDSSSPKVYSYDENTNVLVLSYNYGSLPETTTNISLSSFIKDESGPNRKSVIISSVGQKLFKLEFSEDNESNFTVNPSIDAQLYYKYVFNTKHFSMLNTYLDFSPSINYNIVTEEKVVGSAEPGTNNNNCFVSLKFGFGPNISSNSYNETKDLRFSNYYYFIVASGVQTDQSKIQIISDPLTGLKTVEYSTNDKFVFKVDRFPQENGTGEITYVTNSKNATGIINSLKVDNSGVDYIDIPSLIGVEVPSFRKAVVSPKFDSFGGIESFEILNPGSGYINPKIVVIGDGIQGQYTPIVQNGSISNVSIVKRGSGFTKIPKVEVIESRNKIYLTSDNIGVPKNIFISNSGNFYSSDTSTIPDYRTYTAVVLKNVDEKEFTARSTVRQFNSEGETIFVGAVNNSGIRPGSNIVRIKPLVGSINKNLPLGTAEIVAVLYTDYEVELKSYYDKLGYFNSGKGLVSSADSKITDSYFYQDYSYVIGSNTPISIWRDLIKDVVHPAGFQLFGEVLVEAEKGELLQPTQQAQAPLIRTLNAGVKEAFTHVSKTLVTERLELVKNQNIKRGKGRVSIDDQNLTTTYARDVYLAPQFDGYVDGDTNQIFGTKTFNILDSRTNQPVIPYNEASIVVTISGVVQEPKVSYTVSGSQITFDTAPLGPRVSEGQNLDADEFVGKVIGYKDNTKNQQYFKKIRNIFQRNGIWLDAANQIRSNRNFIIEESYGYLKGKYPDLSFDIGKCKRDIGYIVDAFEHDLRFGGNSKTVTAGEFYFNAANELDFINNELEETREAYLYAASLCAAAIRNWDVAFINDPATPEFEVSVFADSDIINVPSTFGIVEGMYLSSGSQFPLNTRVLEIIDNNTLRVDTSSFTTISDDQAIVLTVPAADVLQLGDGEYEYNGIILEGTLEVEDSSTVTIVARIAKLRQVRFSLSRINPGKFVDAANLVAVNRKYIIQETISYINTTFPGFSNPSEKKCRRDIGYLIDAIVYHLNYGGNNRIIDYAEKYYLANRLNYINNELNETIVGFEYAIALMIDVVENNPGSPFETVDYEVQLDTNDPLTPCADVVSAINSYKDAYTFILENGPNLIQRDFGNIQRSGKYTDLTTYSNYNLIEDEDLLNSVQINGIKYAAECAEVVSSLYTLHQSLDTILEDGLDSVEMSLPDYFNGENKTFELYTDDNEILKTDLKEDLLIYINGVLQRPTSYTVLRSENPTETDKIEFTEAPRWDQNEAQIRLNQGTAVDYFHGVSIGAYERKTVDLKYGNIDDNYTLISLDGTSSSTIIDPRYCIVFVDGVLQKNESDYEIKANRIYFKKKLNYYKPETGDTISSNVDVIQFFGEVNFDTVTAFDFQNNTYLSKATIDIYYESENSDFGADIIEWNRSSATHAPLLYNGSNYIGTVTNITDISDPYPGARFDLLVDNNPELDSSLPLIFKKYRLNVPDYVLDISFTIDQNTVLNQPGETLVYGSLVVNNPYTLTITDTTTVVSSGAVFSYQQDSNEDRILERAVSPYLVDRDYWKNKAWRIVNKTSASILEGDKIKIDGETKFRDIIKVPDIVKTTQFNSFKSTTNKIYGDMIVSPSDERPSGTGLSVSAILGADGSVAGLDWNKPDPIKFTALGLPIPDIANGYQGDVFVDFIPVDGNGGGAFAAANIIAGTVIGFTLISGGSGYTKPPVAVITRGFDIIKSNREISPYIERDYIIRIPRPITVNSQQVTLINPNISDYFVYINTADSLSFREQNLILFLENEVVQGDVAFSITAIPQAIRKEFPVIGTVAPSVKIPEVLFTKPYQSLQAVGASQVTEGQVTYISESFVGAGDTLITPETLAALAALINVQFDIGDNQLFVTSTTGFPPAGILQVGTEVVEYGAKTEDRFYIIARGYGLTTEQTHPVGTQVTVYLPFLNANRLPAVEIESDGFANSPFATFTEIVLLSKEKADSLPSTITILGETDNRRFGKGIEPIAFSDVFVDSTTTKTFFSENITEIGAFFSPSTFTIFLDSEASGQNQAISYKEVDFRAVIETSVDIGQISSAINVTSFASSIGNTSFDVNVITPTEFTFLVENPAGTSLPLDASLTTVDAQEIVSGIQTQTNVDSIQVSTNLTLINDSIILGDSLQISLNESDSRLLFESTTPEESLSVVLLSTNADRQILQTVETYGNLDQAIVYTSDITPIIEPTAIVTQTNAQVDSELITLTQAIPAELLVDVTLVSARIDNIVNETLISVNYTNDTFFAGMSNILQQEIRKQPEDVISQGFTLDTEIEIESTVENIDVVTPVTSETQIDSGVNTGTIDDFNETINPATIETNDP